MVYDCFRFFNEFLLLELRLDTLWDSVDKFVLVECDRTDSGLPKPLYYEENKERFAKYHEKIIHVVVRDYDGVSEPIPMARYQRNCIMRGLTDLLDDDTVLISDVDEIPDPKKLVLMDNLEKYNTVLLVPNLFYYYFNMKCKELGTLQLMEFGTRAIKYVDLKRTTPDRVRQLDDGYVVADAGWHFSFLGDVDFIIEKVMAYGHQEFNNPHYLNKERILNLMKSGGDLFGRKISFQPIPVTADTMPEFVMNNIDRLKELLTK